MMNAQPSLVVSASSSGTKSDRSSVLSRRGGSGVPAAGFKSGPASTTDAAYLGLAASRPGHLDPGWSARSEIAPLFAHGAAGGNSPLSRARWAVRLDHRANPRSTVRHAVGGGPGALRAPRRAGRRSSASMGTRSPV